MKNLAAHRTRYFFNLCCDTNYYQKTVSLIKNQFREAVIICTPNVGKDIGGKLALIDTYLKTGEYTEYLVLLHDKISPHTSMGDSWRKKLLNILEQEKIEQLLGVFKNKEIGLIASRSLIMNEYDQASGSYNCTSSAELHALRSKYKFESDDHSFVGGTMFWVRSALYTDFFTKNKPLEIRKTLEQGNVLDHRSGTFSHAWERMFSWIVSNAGCKIIGV